MKKFILFSFLIILSISSVTLSQQKTERQKRPLLQSSPQITKTNRTHISKAPDSTKNINADFYSTYGQSETQNVTVDAGTYTFEVDGIAQYKNTEWYVNGNYTGADENDWSGIFAIDPDFTYTFSTGSTEIKAIVYDRNWGYEEYHTWNVTVTPPPKKNTKITVTNVNGKWGKPGTLKGKLEEDNFPWYTDIQGETLKFYINNNYQGSATTDNNGEATFAITIPSNFSSGTIKIIFDGDATYNSSDGTGTITVLKHATSVLVFNATIPKGNLITLIALLRDSDNNNTGIPSKSVSWFKNPSIFSNGDPLGTSVTNSEGRAILNYTPTIAIKPGDSLRTNIVKIDKNKFDLKVKSPSSTTDYIETIRVIFDGDTKYDNSSGDGTLTVTETPLLKVDAELMPLGSMSDYWDLYLDGNKVKSGTGSLTVETTQGQHTYYGIVTLGNYQAKTKTYNVTVGEGGTTTKGNVYWNKVDITVKNNGTVIANGFSLSVNNQDQGANLNYTYIADGGSNIVIAVNFNGETLSHSVSYSGWGIGDITFDFIIVKPNKPTNLHGDLVTWNNTNELTLTWQDNSTNEEGFKIEKFDGYAWYPKGSPQPQNTTSWVEYSVNNPYSYRIYAYNSAGNSDYDTVSSQNITGVSNLTSISKTYKLVQNYPNPFNPETTIQYEIPKTGYVTLKIYNSAGQLVTTLVQGTKNAGSYAVTWNAENVSSGVYFYRMTAGSFSAVKKGILLK